MEAISGAGGGTWHALQVRRAALRKSVRTLYIPSSSGITLYAQLSGLVELYGTRERPSQEEAFRLADDVYIIPPGPSRTLFVAAKGDVPATVASLTVPQETLHRFVDEEDLPSRLTQLRDMFPAVRFDPVLALTVRALVVASEAGADELYAQAATQFIAAHLLAAHTDGAVRSAGALSSLQLETVLSYMRENLGRPVSLDDLASLVSFSRFHFVRRFKAATGSTPYRYLTELRIDMSRKYLESGNDTITRIGQRCGFSGPEHFSRSFRRVMGCTPSQYRAMRT
ncbi:AraC family transcriptional regulator [Streptomyces cinnabarinus]|uniref:AraC family transcriptional regulator n=1 Tax=Streptomyces cinnabarinus TaxID=67287 RepID=A0ABY7K578_9ACTN|nr:AraC family transcriptional regulator [Streptomyces cinnabarinus]WAZ19666.1 AraC family transcriptional regulator [Streptomyces cinnabarinus]